MRFYTYVHLTEDTNQIFYIGKGQKARRYSTKHNNHWQAIVNKHGFYSTILAHWETEEEALEHEKLLIASFKDIGYKLANKTDGGEGTSGIIMTEEHRHKLSLAKKGRKLSEEHRKNISKGNKGKVYTHEMRAKSRATKLGHSVSEETREKIRLKLKGTKYSAETIAKRIAVRTGKPTRKKGQKAPTGQCVHCLRIMARNTLAMYHNDKCKLKK